MKAQGGVVLISDLNGTNAKKDFRNYLRERLRLFAENPNAKASAENRIVSNLSKQLSSLVKSDLLIGSFHALPTEPNLVNFYSSTTYPLCFPQLAHPNLQFLAVDSYPQTDWLLDPLGFGYPASGEIVEPSQIQVILVPGLGFNAYGERLGRGKGFYDRYLTNFKGLKIGICFDCQWSDDHLPTDDWDIKMNFIITENKCLEVKD